MRFQTDPNWIRRLTLITLPRLAALILIGSGTWTENGFAAAAADSPPLARPRWTNQALLGSPEPPSPYRVEKILTNIVWTAPLYVAPEPGTDQLWVVLQGGEKDRPSRIVRVENRADAAQTEPVLTVENRLIYGLTFHPDFATNRYVYVFSNGPTGAEERTNQVTRYTVSAPAPRTCDPASAHVVIAWRSAGHDGGDLAFGRDGLLYITAGDGTSDSDTWDSGQDVSNLLATLIRIDVANSTAAQPYRVPPDNPFVNLPGARPEIWAYGFRNPWRMGIDERTGDIWVGNNGQDLWETAYLVRKGDNFGWSVTEGKHPFYAQRRRGPTPIVSPTIEHHHAEFRSLTGGVVYYGKTLPELNGAYIYGDYATGKIWGARHRNGQLVWQQELADTTLQIAAFRVDSLGNLVVVDHAGSLYRLLPRPPGPATPPFPRRLSETGLFTAVADEQPAPGLIAYDVNAPAWRDGAHARRWIALPGDARIQQTTSRGWGFTNGSVLVQTLSLTPTNSAGTSRRRVETRILLRQDNEWAGYTYRWNDAQTDAHLVPKGGETIALALTDASGAPQTRTWKIPSRTECLACHARAVNYVLGLTDLQMNRIDRAGGSEENQLTRLRQLDALAPTAEAPTSVAARLVDPYDPTEPLEQRARSYLQANCAVCHVEAGGGNAQMQLEFGRKPEQMQLIGARPQHDSFGIANAMLIAPGEPDRSVLLHRVSRRGPGQMPPLGTAQVDHRAVALLRDWIAQMKPARPLVQAWQWSDLEPLMDQVHAQRPRAAGKALFTEIGCSQCHRLGPAGGSVGPDLTGLARRSDKRFLLESMLEPSKVIAEAYLTHELEQRDGSIISGRIEREEPDVWWVRAGSAVEELVRVAKSDVVRRQALSTSNMPAGMLDVLTREQILDLMAYILADGVEP